MEQKFIPHPEYTFNASQLPATEDAIILVDKPAGISSFGVVAKVRGALKQKFGHKVKVGHTGTLDPFATGLLILLTGKMTKKSNEFLKLDKVYEATLKLGFTSTTGDPEGEVQEYPSEESKRTKFTKIEEHKGKIFNFAAEGAKQCDKILDLSHCGASEISEFCRSFIGTITQTPPRFSAIKINGQRAYQLARKNVDFKIPSRQVTIYDLKILDYNYPELKIRCEVSSGTYIRTLAEDIGIALGTGAYLTSLRRTKIGNYSIKDAHVL